jgi:hypothetical protein
VSSQVFRPKRNGLSPQAAIWVFATMLLAFIPMHMPSWADDPPSIDPVNFKLALADYDVSADRPHSPGYPAIVFGARLMARWIGASESHRLWNLTILIVGLAAGLAVLSHAKLAAVGFETIALTLSHTVGVRCNCWRRTDFALHGK